MTVRSPVRSDKLSGVPWKKLSNTVVCAPSLSNSRTTAEPTKPAPPATRTRCPRTRSSRRPNRDASVEQLDIRGFPCSEEGMKRCVLEVPFQLAIVFDACLRRTQGLFLQARQQ